MFLDKSCRSHRGSRQVRKTNETGLSFAASQLRSFAVSVTVAVLSLSYQVLPSPTKSYPILALVLVVRLPVMALSWPWTKDDKNLCIATRTFKGKVCSHLQRWTMVNHHCLVTFMFWMTFVDDFVNLLQQCSMKSCEGQHGNTQNHRTKWLWRQLGIWNTL